MLQRQQFHPEAETGRTLQVHIRHTVRQGLERTVLHGDGSLCMSFQRKVLYRRSGNGRALIDQLCHTLTTCVLAVLNVDTDIIAVLHHGTQIHYIPEVIVRILRVTGNPVEGDCGRTACTFGLFGQTDLQRDILCRDHFEEDCILHDILKQVTRQLLAVRLVSCQRLGALLVSDRIRTLQRELCRNIRSIGAAQVLNKNRRELSGFLTCLVHRDLIPYGIAAMLHHAVFPIELNSSQAGFVRFSRLRRFGGSPEANALVGLNTDPDRIRHHGIRGVT